MTLTTISIIAATAIYLAYNAICLVLFAIPESLSNTYYLWKEKCDDMRMAFGRIKTAIANKMEFVEFYISD